MKIRAAIRDLTITPASEAKVGSDGAPDSARDIARVASMDPFVAQLQERRSLIDSKIDGLDAERARIESRLSELRRLLGHYNALLIAEAAVADLPKLTDR